MKTPFWYKIKKKLKWEFAPAWLVYFPIVFLWFYWAIRARSFVFFTGANPSIETGGFFGESKFGILIRIDAKNVPATIFIPDPSILSKELIMSSIQEKQMHFPIILKPDKGERGRGVEKIHTEVELEAYLQKYRFPLLIQAFAAEKEEFGIMYHRYPNEKKGRVTSIVQKGFLAVVGDGKSSLDELFLADERCLFHREMLLNLYAGQLNIVLPKGEKKILVSIGNHSRGTTFLNGNALITPNLSLVFDEIADKFEGFYIGRFDLKADSIEEVVKGNFKIMELNGVGAEPGHIYAPDNPLFDSYASLIKHWNRIFKIAKMNFDNGLKRTSFGEVWASYKEYEAYQNKYF